MTCKKENYSVQLYQLMLVGFLIMLTFSSCEDTPTPSEEEPSFITELTESTFFESLQEAPFGLSPLFVLGDINQDLLVNEQDRILLEEIIYENQIPKDEFKAGICQAAGDLTRDNIIDSQDIDLLNEVLEYGDITGVPLYANLSMICDYNQSLFAASSQVFSGNVFHFRIQTNNYHVSNLELSLDGPYEEIEILPEENGFNILIPENIVEETVLNISFTTTSNQLFHYAIPIYPFPDQGENPPPVFPPEQPSENLSDCPQRGEGIEALIIDYSLFTWEGQGGHTPFELNTTLGNLGARVHYVAPKFKNVPTNVTYSIPFTNVVLYSNQQTVQSAKAHNALEMQKMLKQINTYTHAVHEGRELAFELIWAHGSRNTYTSCGSVGSVLNTGQALRRDSFHTRIHRAIKNKVCAHTAIDYSCYSGLSCMAVDELCNQNRASCNNLKINNRLHHPSYEADLALSSSSPTERCTYGEVEFYYHNLKVLFDNEVLKRQNAPVQDAQRLIQALVQHNEHFRGNTLYRDEGYKSMPSIIVRKGY